MKKMVISNIVSDISGLLFRQLKFYCRTYRLTLDKRQRQELIDTLHEQHFERLANKIKFLNQSVANSRQEIAQLLFEHCQSKNRRNQIIQLIESKLVDINVPLDNYARTLLHRAAYNLDVELVKILIEHGVDIRACDYSGNTALHIAIQSYRNGAVIYGDKPDVVQNLTSIIELLIEADKKSQSATPKDKELKNIERNLENQSMDIEFINEEHGTNFGNDNNNGMPTLRQSSYNLIPIHFGVEPNLKRQTLTKRSNSVVAGKYQYHDESSNKTITVAHKSHEFARQIDDPGEKLDTFASKSLSSKTGPLIDLKNNFGRTALHYCVLVVGEPHLAHFVKLLISHGADTDAMDNSMRTPLHCLVRRSGIAAIRQKCLAITHLLRSGCDDLGLAISPEMHFSEELLRDLEKDITNLMLSKSSNGQPNVEPIFNHSTFKRVPRLKHLARLRLIKREEERIRLRENPKNRCQPKIILPEFTPAILNLYVNRKILDQSELF